MKNLIQQFLMEHKGKRIRLILSNGFQIKGTLEDFDNNALRLQTDAYNSDYAIIVISLVSTFAPYIDGKNKT